jgi:hypothetical protein
MPFQNQPHIAWVSIIPGVRLISQVSNKSTLGSNTPYLFKHSIFGMVTGIKNCDSGGI